MRGKLVAIEADPMAAKIRDESGHVWVVPVDTGLLSIDMLGGDVEFAGVVTRLSLAEGQGPKMKPKARTRAYKADPAATRRARFPPATMWMMAGEWAESVGISLSRYYQIRHHLDADAMMEFVAGKSRTTMIRAGTPKPPPKRRRGKSRVAAKASPRWKGFPTEKAAWQQRVDAFEAALEPGWIRATVYAETHGISTKAMPTLCLKGAFPEGSVRRVAVGTSGVAKWWAILESTPPPKPKSKPRKKREVSRFKAIAPRNVEPPKPGDEKDGRAEFFPRLDAAIKALRDDTADPIRQDALFKLLIQNFGLTDMAERFGVSTEAMRLGLVSKQQVGRALRIAWELRKEMDEQLDTVGTGGFAMPGRD